MKHQIIDPADGTVLGTIQFDPFQVTPSREGKNRDVGELFDGVEDAPVMDTAAPPGDSEDTAAEAWEDPDPEEMKKRVGEVLYDQGWAVRERGDSDGT